MKITWIVVCIAVLSILCGCRETWQPDVCMEVVHECPAQNAVVDKTEDSGAVPACHWLGSFKYLEVPDGIRGSENSAPTGAELMAARALGPTKAESAEFMQKTDKHSQSVKKGVSDSAKQSRTAGTPEPAGATLVGALDCVDINTADEMALIRLPGVGAGKAKAIIASRDKRPFRRKKDITRIKGIGPKSYQKMAAMICDVAR